MITRRTALAGLLCTGLLSACGFQSASLRYRVTVEIDTPQGLRTGSSVWLTRANSDWGAEGSRVNSRSYGEAVAVDLPNGTLFALMRGADGEADYASRVVQRHLAGDPRFASADPSDWAAARRMIQNSKISFQLGPDELPMLVRFRDPADPMTVERVNPANLAASFGVGVRLRGITIEITDDPVTQGIRNRFPWWENYLDRHFDGTSTVSEDLQTNNLAARLSSGSFSTEARR